MARGQHVHRDELGDRHRLYTVTAHWHRLSDTLCADLIALALGSVASYWMLRRGRIEPYSGSRVYRGRVVYVAAATAVASLGLLLGVWLGIVSISQGLADDTSRFNAYLSAQVPASAASTFTALIFWATWHRLETKDVPRTRARRGAAERSGSVVSEPLPPARPSEPSIER